MDNTLYGYYNSKGQALPSVQERQGIASSAGIQNYTGTAQQNTQLLNYLKSNNQTVNTGTPKPVDVSSLNQNQNPIVLPTINTPTNNQTTPTVQVQPNYADTALKVFDLNNLEQGAVSSQESIIANQLKALSSLTGETQSLYDEQQKAGVQQKKQELNTINSQILQKQAEINQDNITLVNNMRNAERHDTLLPFAQENQAKLQGDASIMRALKSSEIGVLNALALSKQGDIQLAQETAQQAVDLKYAPYKDAIEIGNAQLKAIQPFLDKAEKKQALALQTKANLAMKEIDKVSDFQKTALNNAILNGAPQSVLSSINSAGSMEDILKVGGQYIVSESDKLDIDIKKLQKEKLVQETTIENGGKPPTDTQIQNAGFADRIAQANNIVDSNSDTFKNMNYAQFKLAESTSPLANSLLTDKQRQVAQAMRNFVTAKLRKESGAAISQSEFDDARAQYFPSLGDDTATLAQKKTLRDSVLSNLIQGSGSAYKTNSSTLYLDSVESALKSNSPSSVFGYISSLNIKK